MRQLSITFLLISILFWSFSPAFSAVKGGINYSIPIDYSKLSEAEINDNAKYYFFLAERSSDKDINENFSNALFLYNTLTNINPKNPKYYIKLGILYDKLEKDRLAKGNFSKAIGINPLEPESYYYFGKFYHKREMLRKALKYYNQAYQLGYDKNYDLLYSIGDIYEKLGDTRSALKFLQEASKQSPNTNIENKIRKVEINHSINKEFYSNTRIKK